ncbi:hypothetical protein BB558_005319 [Smittium angustum]|uniref:DNA polymerase delta subunit OB-fold domain-containing protein n=1 Tax=Smittium angustum TaxID=133377 RepID=A0A2U1J129_SMIAN|nr:hypothetical protein BB558_005319 [Smittium angustum]
MVSNNPQLARLKSNVDTTKNTFIITPESYQQQFSGIYRQRLQALWPRLVEAARSKWIEFDEGIEIMEKISSVSDICERVVLIGTVFLEQKLKPSILEEVSKSQWEKETPLPEKYWSEEDLVWLEDETGRINVISDPKGKIPVLITGMVVSVLGSSTKDGRFVVEDVEYAGMPVQSPVLDVSKDRQKHGKSEYVAIVSGFGVTGDSGVSRNMQLLADFLGGLLGGEEMRELSSKIGSLIVAGNSIDGRGVYGGKINEKMGKLGLRNTNDNVLGREVVVEKRSYVELDNYLSQIAGILPVILMPGDTDPVSQSLPQQTFPVDILLPKSGSLGSLIGTSNPTWLEIDKLRFLGTSGQNIRDMEKCVRDIPALDLCEATLKSRHLAPTGPDTLAMYPSSRGDAMLLDRAPDVYFVGNMESFGRRRVSGGGGEVEVVMVPEFKSSGEVVLVDTFTLRTESVKFC